MMSRNYEPIESKASLKIDQQVIWIFRPSHGFGAVPIPIRGMVKKINPKTVTIEVMEKQGNAWFPVRKNVKFENLRWPSLIPI